MFDQGENEAEYHHIFVTNTGDFISVMLYARSRSRWPMVDGQA